MCFFLHCFLLLVFSADAPGQFYLRYISSTNGTLVFLHENAHARSTTVTHRVVALTDGKNTYPKFYFYYNFFFSTVVFNFWSPTDIINLHILLIIFFSSVKCTFSDKNVSSWSPTLFFLPGIFVNKNTPLLQISFDFMYNVLV